MNYVCVQVLTNYMSQRLCAAGEKRYWYCFDFDFEVVDFDPETGNTVRKGNHVE